MIAVAGGIILAIVFLFFLPLIIRVLMYAIPVALFCAVILGIVVATQ